MKKQKLIIMTIILMATFIFTTKLKASVITSSDKLYINSLFNNCGNIKFNGSTSFTNSNGGLMCKHNYSVNNGGDYYNYIEFNLNVNNNYDYLVIPITLHIQKIGDSVDNRVLLNNLQWTAYINGYKPLYYEILSVIDEYEQADGNNAITINYNLFIEVKDISTFGRIYYTINNMTLYKYTMNIFINPNMYYVKSSTSQIIENQNNNTQTIINQDTTYNNTSEEINGTQEMDEYKDTEDTIIQSLNFTALDDSTVNLDMSASNFIWDMVEGIRGISTKIVSFMTSILALGIFKMILNR